MRILRDPSDVDALPAGLVRSLVHQRIAELSIDEPFDPAVHGFFVIVESGDGIDDIEQRSGCRLRSNHFSPARYVDEDFVPDWESLEFHPGSEVDPGYFEFTFVLSDDGFGVVLLSPDIEGIDPDLLALCRTYVTPSAPPTSGQTLRCHTYLRSDAFIKRRRMMQQWADFCDKDQKAVKDKVVPIRAAS